MPLIFHCPACGRDLEAPDGAEGSAGSCRFCGAHITAPPFPNAPARLISPGVPPTEAPGVYPPPADQATGYLDAGAVVSEAWGYLKAHWATLLAANLIVGLIAIAVVLPFLWSPLREFIRTYRPGNVFVLPPGAQVPITIIAILLSPLAAGPLYVADRIIARGESGLGAVFQGLRHYSQLVQLALLYNVPFWGIALVIAGVGMISRPAAGMLSVLSWPLQAFIFIALGLAQMEVIDRGVDGLTALKTSWQVTEGHRWMILATYILLFLAYMVGILACCIGVFFTLGFLTLGPVIIYRHLRGLQGTPDA